MMRNFLAALGVAAFTGVFMPAIAQEATVDVGGESYQSRELVLPLGKAAIIDLPRAASDILVSNPGIVDAVIRTPRRVYIMGREAGQANAFFFDRQNQQILNLEIRVEQDSDSIQHLLDKLLPDSRIEVETLNGSIILHGTVDTASEAERAERIAERFAGTENLVNMLSVREPAQVLLKVRIVEMQRRLIRQLGIDLNGVAQVDSNAVSFAVQNSFPLSGEALGGISGTVNTPGFGDISNLDFAFDVFEQNGLVKTLAEPSIVSVSGREGSFLAGGEFPVPEAGADGTPSVTFRPFGVQLQFQPLVFSKGRIQLNLSTSVSELSAANGLTVGGSRVIDENGNIQTVGGFIVPGVTSRNASTTVELPSGGSIAIAGLLQENISDFVDGVPGIKETPILGALFRSQEFRSNQTELVIIATPYLVQATDGAKLTDPSQGHAPPTVLQSALLGKLETSYGVQGARSGSSKLGGPMGFILD
ncbi:type II and III secretion system protein family protein [Parvularcula marina]|nr:type II and III secretion system protein family protein [Parvularcula marina]